MIPDTPTSISTTIVNYGKADETNINVKFIIDGTVLDTELIGFLASQEEQIVNFPFTPNLGVYNIRVEIQTVQGENIVYNNFRQQGFIAGPDISIDSVISEEPPFYLYAPSEFEITIKNLGVVDVQNIVVQLFVGSTVVDSINIPFLAGGNSYTTTMNWVPSDSGWCDLSFYAQPVDYESYTSISNNYYNTSIYPVNSNSKLYVDDDGNKDFKDIKQALYWACPDVTIYVNPGKYYGKILLDEKVDIIGSDSSSTIIYGYSFDYIIQILADQVTIKGFTFREADRGIRIVEAQGCVIEDNNFLDIYQTEEIYTWIDGDIVLLDSSFITIKNNYIFNTENLNDDGLKIEGCSNIYVENNTIVNSGDGIYIDNSNNIHIYHNIIDGHSKFCSWGIRTKSNCHDNIFENNTLYSNAVAMVIYGGENNLIKENKICYNRLKRCTYFTEGTGIYIEDESNSIFKDNLISLNLRGIVVYSSNNLFYGNNLIKNDLNANDDGTNTWYNATLQEGNYWSDYTGVDNNSDGIGDTPYDVPGAGNNHDNCPAMAPFGTPDNAPYKPVKPSGPANGKPGVGYTYSTSTTDPDGGFVLYGWDWNGDKNVDEWIGLYESGKTVSASHAWETQGTYSIYVKAMDIYGFESEWSDPLSVTIPRSRAINRPFLQFLEKLADYFPLLARLLELL